MENNKVYESFIIAIRVLISIPEFVELMQTTDLFDYEEENALFTNVHSNELTLPYNVLTFVQHICDKIHSGANLSNADIQKEISTSFQHPQKAKINTTKNIKSLLSLEIIERIISSIKFMYNDNPNFTQRIDTLFGGTICTISTDGQDAKFNTMILENYLLNVIKLASEYLIFQLQCKTQTEDISFIKNDVLVTKEKIKYHLFGVIVMQTTDQFFWYFLKYNDKDKTYLKYTYNSHSHEVLSSLDSLFEKNWFRKRTKTIQVTALIFKKTK